jgi:hypothetical protein
MHDILVATVARPQDVDSDERLGERQQQMPIPNQGAANAAGVIEAAGDRLLSYGSQMGEGPISGSSEV